MRRVFMSFLFTLVIVISLVPHAKANNIVFKDVPKNHPYYSEIMYLLEKGVIDSKETYGVNDKVTREEVAVMVSRAVGLNGKQTATKFKDVPYSLSSSGYINSAVNAGIINGYTDGTFKPKSLVTRGHMATFISRGFKLTQQANINFTDVPEGSTPYEHVKKLVFKNITTGFPDGSFRANDNLSRAHLSVFIARAMGYGNLKDIRYGAIKINGKMYGYNSSTGDSEIYPYLTQVYEAYNDGESHILVPSLLDVRQYSEDTFGTQSGIFNLLQIVVGEYTIVPSNNPFLDGNIKLNNASGNWMTTNKDLQSSILKLGYEKKYESASKIVEEGWYEYDGKRFYSPINSIKSNWYLENGISYVNLTSRRSYGELFFSINDLLKYWGINKVISYGNDGELTYIEIKE